MYNGVSPMTNRFSLLSFAAGIVVGALLAALVWFVSTNVAPSPSPQAQSTSSSMTNATSTSGILSVSDQSAGSTVLIDSVTVPPPGVWVAVRETNGTDLGNVLGAVRVGAPRSNVSVSLLRATEPGRTYAVELYRDDDNGNFDPGLNSVYVDTYTGSSVIAYFTTTQ
jgi:hypothetical protein